jgi:catechol 2,3-dioxygenase-like lactoylglutathione lyase family enzyme
MLTHLCVGAHDIDASEKFYDAALAPLGIVNKGRLGDRAIAYAGNGGRLLVLLPRDDQPATFANGATLGFNATSEAAVNAFYAGGIANGGTDEGAPGAREGARGAYGAYLRDPVGNKICAFFGLEFPY